ncbi:MAG: hypothetical protein COX51_09410 [Syntrophobacteraceae bacterium CG23_combo_of_CG06-09_8_20_14_all_50_8]|nr:MAG: hypothetical protein COX51_09410 [Syntrophobacteraceae bacterium CG23_combo_of_CG06-09_8_20_14_all_50_8]
MTEPARVLTRKEIAKFIGLDSLHYLSLSGMVKATEMDAENFCLACYDGRYPITPPANMEKFRFEGERRYS